MDRIEAIKVIKDNWPESRHQLSEALKTLVPELNESEDERIRKNLREFLLDAPSQDIVIHHLDLDETLNWLEKKGEQPNKVSIWKHWNNGIAGNGEGKLIYLVKSGNTYRLSSCLGFECDYIELSELDKLYVEKQGEQKPTDKVESKFKVGDWIVTNNGEPQVFRVEKRGWPDSIISGSFGNEYINTFTLDKRHHLWTIQDAKNGDVITYPDNTIVLFKNLHKDEDEGMFTAHCLYVDNKIEEMTTCAVANIHPATKEQRDLLFSKMKEAGYKWDAEKKELKKIGQEEDAELTDFESALFSAFSDAWQEYLSGKEVNVAKWTREHSAELLEVAREQKPTWSEEDEKHYQGCLNAMKLMLNAKPYPYYNDHLWLKSLKDRVKPQSKQEWSEEEKARIEKIIDILDWVEEKGRISYSDWEDYVTYVKSLKPQSNQKPAWSEEDKKMINSIIKYLDEGEWLDIYQVDWLKSLKKRMKGE